MSDKEKTSIYQLYNLNNRVINNKQYILQFMINDNFDKREKDGLLRKCFTNKSLKNV